MHGDPGFPARCPLGQNDLDRLLRSAQAGSTATRRSDDSPDQSEAGPRRQAGGLAATTLFMRLPQRTAYRERGAVNARPVVVMNAIQQMHID
jgi:hypothetical protein